MSTDDRPGIRHAPNRSGRVSQPFRDLLSRYGASPELLQRVTEVAAPVADHHPAKRRNPAPATEERLTYRPFVAIEMDGYGRNSVPQRVRMRDLLQRVVDAALVAVPIDPTSLLTEDRGDGMLILFSKSVSITEIAGPFIRTLAESLRARTSSPAPGALRLRLAIGHGLVSVDNRGVTGSPVNSTFRLLDTSALREALLRAPEAQLAVVVPDEIFQSVIRRDYRDVEPATFAPVDVDTKESHGRAWIHVPGYAYPPGMTPLEAGPGPGPTVSGHFVVTGDAGAGVFHGGAAIQNDGADDTKPHKGKGDGDRS